MTQPFFPPQAFKQPMTEELRFQIFLAKLFGVRRQFTQDGWMATAYYFRGITYLTECRPLNPGEVLE